MSWSLEQVAAALRESWSAATCDPADLYRWQPDNPARGQCGSSSFVVQDLLGGDLVLAEVRLPDGTTDGVHYWNRLPDGTEIDLTREQFVDDEELVAPAVVARIPGPPDPRSIDQYLALLQAVLAKLPPADVTVEAGRRSDA